MSMKKNVKFNLSKISIRALVNGYYRLVQFNPNTSKAIWNYKNKKAIPGHFDREFYESGVIFVPDSYKRLVERFKPKRVCYQLESSHKERIRLSSRYKNNLKKRLELTNI